MKKKIVLGWIWIFILFSFILWLMYWKIKESRKFILPVGVNIAIISGDRVGVLAVRGGADEFSAFLRLPGNLFLYLPDGGRYRANSIWRLGELKDDIESGSLLMDSLSRNLSIPVSAYLKLRDEPLSVDGVLDALVRLRRVTNLSWWDRYALRSVLSVELKRQRVVLQRLPRLLISETEDPDGLMVLSLDDTISVANWARNGYVMDAVLRERLSATIINNSSRAGEARVLGRMVDTAGIKVVELFSNDGVDADTCVYAVIDDMEGVGERPSEIFLNKILGCRREQDLGVDLDEYRSDMVIVTGKKKIWFR